MGQVSKGFELFLDRISSRAKGNTFSSLSWVAETLLQPRKRLRRGRGQRAARRSQGLLREIAEDRPEDHRGGKQSDKDFAPAGAGPRRQAPHGPHHRRLRRFEQGPRAASRGPQGEVEPAQRADRSRPQLSRLGERRSLNTR